MQLNRATCNWPSSILFAGLLLLLVRPLAVQAVAAYNGGRFVENFNALGTVNTQWTNDVTLPGWYAYESLTGNIWLPGGPDPNWWLPRRYLAGASQLGGLFNIAGDGGWSPENRNRALGIQAFEQDRVIALVLSNATSRVFESFSLSYLGQQWLYNYEGGDRLDFTFAIRSDFPVEPWNDNNGIMNPTPVIPHSPDAPQNFSAGFVDPVGELLDYVSVYTQNNAQPPTGRSVAGEILGIHWEPGSILILRWFNNYDGRGAHREQLVSIDDLVLEATPSPEPMFFIDGKLVRDSAFTSRGPAVVSMETAFPGGAILYTLDGSDPGLSSRLYTAPVKIPKTSTLRAVAFDQAFSATRQSRPLRVVTLHALTLDTPGGGELAVDPPTGGYRENRTAAISASPSPGWEFLHWLGDADGAEPEAILTMSADRHVRAVFGTQLEVRTLGAGSVEHFPLTDLTPYGTSVRLSAVPAPGNYFAFWSGAAVGTDARISLSVTSATPSITAVFQPLPAGQVSLAVSETGLGRVELNASGSRFAAGRRLRFTATPAPGQTFLGWAGDATGSDLVLETVMDASKHIVAAFTQRPTLSTSSPLSGPTPEGFRFTISGVPGDVYAVGGFRFPGEWGVLGLITNRYGVEQWRDSASKGMGYRFYGVSSP